MRTGTVTNGTRYSGTMLRSVFLAVVSHVEKVTGHVTPIASAARAALIRKRCEITYVYTRNGSCSGRAAYSGLRMRIRIAREETDFATLVWLVQHEVYHLFGVRHREMPDAVNRWSPSALDAVRGNFPDLFKRYGAVVREEPVQEKPKATIDQKRASTLASIEARIARWESKARRAENALKKLRRQKRYYESKVANAETKS